MGQASLSEGLFDRGGCFEGESGQEIEGMIEFAGIPPLTVTKRGVDSIVTSFVPNFEMGLEEVPVLAMGLVVEEESQEEDSWDES